MLNYAVCEISGKQYKVIPGKTFTVDLQKGNGAEIEANVLLLSENSKLKIGEPCLKEKLTLKQVEDIKGKKMRVAKFHAKANYRRIKGYRSKLTRVVLAGVTSEERRRAPIGT